MSFLLYLFVTVNFYNYFCHQIIKDNKDSNSFYIMAKKEKATVSKKKNPLVSRTNEVVQSFSENGAPEFVKNPVLYTQVRGNFSLTQTNLMIAIVTQLQDRINEQIGTGNLQGSLFRPEDFTGNLLQLEIPLKDLGISPKKYGELEAAKEGLLHMDMTYRRYDEKEKREYLDTVNIFHKISIPVVDEKADGTKIAYKGGSRRAGFMKIEMVDECARDILNLRLGYIEQLKDIAQLCRSPRTPRLYMYLSAFRKYGGCTMNYIDLKEFFGLLKFNQDHKKIISNQYKYFAAFHRDVLDPAQKEMKKLSDENKVEFYFEYEPIYPRGVTRGDPESIKFKIIEGQFGKYYKQQRREGRVHSDLISRYKLQPDEWEKLEPLLQGIDISDELERIDTLIEEKKPKVVHAYVTKVLYNYLTERQVDHEDEYAAFEETPQRPLRPRINDAQRRCYNRWMDLCHERVGDQFFNTFMDPKYSDIWMVDTQKKCVYVAVPSKFVREKWEENAGLISTPFFTVFGPEASYAFVEKDLSEYE